ncbi:MAG: ribonuclease D [Planctomycetes bacterium]|nr:ribonuclease D [Planctomycetota bacterium]
MRLQFGYNVLTLQQMEEPKQILISDPKSLAQCCDHLRQCRRFGFDTEFIGEKSYHPELCLIQVAAADTLYLIDPFAFDSLEPFWNVVVDPAIQVVVHAGREEVRLCHYWSGQTPGNLFDLQIAAGLVGLPYPLGHGSLVAQVLGVKLGKGETLTAWNTRPLTAAQVQYAYDDVRYLLPLCQELGSRLELMGRGAWAEEEFARLRSQSTPDEDGLAVNAEKWRKLKGSSSFERRRLAVLRELFFWRERTALEVNRPPRTVVRDDLLVEITRRNPKSVKDLIPVRGLAKRHLEDIFRAVEAGRAIPPEECPEPFRRDEDPPQVSLAVNLLAANLAYLSAKHQIAGNLIATTGDLKALVRSHMQKGEIPTARTPVANAPGSLLSEGWRRTHFLPQLIAMLEGRMALRLGDLSSETPVEVFELKDG